MGVASLGPRGTSQDWSAFAVCLLPGPVLFFFFFQDLEGRNG